ALTLAAILDHHGTEVKIIQRGEDVIEAINQFRPDAVVMDISLPGIDGIETYRQLAEAYPAIPVMFSSGYDLTEFRNRFNDSDVKFLQKPYAVETFLDCLNRTMSQESVS
ncbi:MAG TPA: response regulator, partial [Thermoanaerobaculia bacterium]|nr:response regulator [Thermoanaerobaculia bacterium]